MSEYLHHFEISDPDALRRSIDLHLEEFVPPEIIGSGQTSFIVDAGVRNGRHLIEKVLSSSVPGARPDGPLGQFMLTPHTEPEEVLRRIGSAMLLPADQFRALANAQLVSIQQAANELLVRDLLPEDQIVLPFHGIRANPKGSPVTHFFSKNLSNDARASMADWILADMRVSPRLSDIGLFFDLLPQDQFLNTYRLHQVWNSPQASGGDTVVHLMREHLTHLQSMHRAGLMNTDKPDFIPIYDTRLKRWVVRTYDFGSLAVSQDAYNRLPEYFRRHVTEQVTQQLRVLEELLPQIRPLLTPLEFSKLEFNTTAALNICHFAIPIIDQQDARFLSEQHYLALFSLVSSEIYFNSPKKFLTTLDTMDEWKFPKSISSIWRRLNDSFQKGMSWGQLLEQYAQELDILLSLHSA